MIVRVRIGHHFEIEIPSSIRRVWDDDVEALLKSEAARQMVDLLSTDSWHLSREVLREPVPPGEPVQTGGSA
jgi:hypothetical protein